MDNPNFGYAHGILCVIHRHVVAKTFPTEWNSRTMGRIRVSWSSEGAVNENVPTCGGTTPPTETASWVGVRMEIWFYIEHLHSLDPTCSIVLKFDLQDWPSSLSTDASYRPRVIPLCATRWIPNCMHITLGNLDFWIGNEYSVDTIPSTMAQCVQCSQKSSV